MAGKQFDADGKPVSANVESYTAPVHVAGARTGDIELHPVDAHLADPEHAQAAAAADAAPVSWYQRAKKAATHGLDVDIHKVVKTDAAIHDIHENAEVFEPRVEYAFSYLQVFSAICVIFAHGAGEVGYMAGPLATIWDVYRNGALNKNVKPPVWIILIGAVGLVIGLATYGYNVTRAMGVKLAKLTPTRGFAAELATAFIIMIAAQYGLPTSSSQCITGAIVGVGVLEGAKGVNWNQFVKQFLSWMSTLVVIGLCVAAVFSQGVYAPSAISGRQVDKYEDRMVELSTSVYKDFNTTLQSFREASVAGAVPQLSPQQWQNLNTTVNKAYATAKDLTNTKKRQTGKLLTPPRRLLSMIHFNLDE